MRVVGFTVEPYSIDRDWLKRQVRSKIELDEARNHTQQFRPGKTIEYSYSLTINQSPVTFSKRIYPYFAAIEEKQRVQARPIDWAQISVSVMVLSLLSTLVMLALRQTLAKD